MGIHLLFLPVALRWSGVGLEESSVVHLRLKVGSQWFVRAVSFRVPILSVVVRLFLHDIALNFSSVALSSALFYPQWRQAPMLDLGELFYWVKYTHCHCVETQSRLLSRCGVRSEILVNIAQGFGEGFVLAVLENS